MNVYKAHIRTGPDTELNVYVEASSIKAAVNKLVKDMQPNAEAAAFIVALYDRDKYIQGVLEDAPEVADRRLIR